ncbi:hypothetical protein [Candidatus Methylomirabilis sp.]|uniref:hypothetical protein n=1 Tax=Candidatus Methylomirabilis sp. TaxID=2032687 RepID=UPI003C7063A2
MPAAGRLVHVLPVDQSRPRQCPRGLGHAGLPSQSFSADRPTGLQLGVNITLGYPLEEILKSVLRWSVGLDDEFVADYTQLYGTALLQTEFVRKSLGESQGKTIAPFLNSCSHTVLL